MSIMMKVITTAIATTIIIIIIKHNWHTSQSLLTITLTAVCAIALLAATAEYVAGHGATSETFPPTELNGQLVTLEVSSSAPPPPETTGRPPAGIKPGEDLQIAMALIDSNSQITLRDVTFLVKAELGDRFLFEQEFEADGGFLVFNFVSTPSDSPSPLITVDDLGNTDNEPDVLAYLLGSESRTVNVIGPNLADGGLYKFDIAIITAGDYANRLDDANQITYNSGISIPQITTYGIDDPNFGKQYIRVITYYDNIDGFEYDSESKEIKYFMPFEWSDENLEQSYVVHEEISIPDTYGDLLVSGFEMHINGVNLPQDMITIDDFFVGERIIHFIIPQEKLYDIRDNSNSTVNSEFDGMNFVIKPDIEHTRIASVTENGQFRIFASWEPEELKSGQKAKIVFEVTDVFLKNLPVAADYKFTMTKNDKVIYEQDGTSTDSRDNPTNVAEFEIPHDISGIVHLNFVDIDGGERAKTSIPIVIDRIAGKAIVDDGTRGITEEDTTNTEDDTMKENGGCLVATAAYDSEMALQVQQLRELRDEVILGTASGTAFMSGFNTVYYSFSPAIADIQREHLIFKETTKTALIPMLASLELFNHINIETEVDMLAYGIAIIVLNVIMYAVLPVTAVIFASKKLKKEITAHLLSRPNNPLQCKKYEQ